jgi:cyclohexyl-isocyanide hydratase
MNPTPHSNKNVVFVLYDGVTLMDFVGATEVFNSTPGFTVAWLAPTNDPITTSEKMQVLPTGTFEDAPEQIEILFVPGGYYKGVSNAMFDLRYRKFIHETSKTAVWTGSVCTGAFILTAAGALNGCTVTTYWSQLENLSLLNEKYGLQVAPGYPRYLLDETRKRFTGGGISSSVDLALELVERIAGKETSQKSQLYIQYAPHPPNESGDPSQAPKEITDEVLEAEAGYTAEMKNSVLELLSE